MNKKPRPARKHFPLKPKKVRTLVAQVHLSKDVDDMLKYLWGHFRLSIDDIVDEAVREKYAQFHEEQ